MSALRRPIGPALLRSAWKEAASPPWQFDRENRGKNPSVKARWGIPWKGWSTKSHASQYDHKGALKWKDRIQSQGFVVLITKGNGLQKDEQHLVAGFQCRLPIF